MNKLFRFRQYLTHQINTIPKKNKTKFQSDLLKLIEYAHKENYENIEVKYD